MKKYKDEFRDEDEPKKGGELKIRRNRWTKREWKRLEKGRLGKERQRVERMGGEGKGKREKEKQVKEVGKCVSNQLTDYNWPCD